MVKLISKILSFLLFAVMVASCNQTSDQKEVLAKINDLEVTEAHFESAFKKYYYQSGQVLEPTYSNKSSVLDNEFNVYVLATYATQLGIKDSEEGQRKLGMIKRKVLNEDYLDRYILSNVTVTEDDTRQMFLRFNTQLTASHLYTPTKEKADSIYSLIQQGRTFEELAPQLFKNKRLAESGGNLGTFTVDEMDVAFEHAAYSLKVGEISEPVKTAQGYSIIKLTNRYPKPVLSEYEYTVNKDQLAYFTEKQKRELITREHMYNFLDNLNLDENNIQSLWDYITANYSAFMAYETELSAINNLSREAQLVSYLGDVFTINDFFTEYRFTPESNLYNIQDYSGFKNFIKGLAYRKHLMNKAIEEDLLQDEDVQASIDQTFYVFLAQQAEDEIRSNIEVTDQEIADLYYGNPAKYMKPLEVDLSRIIVDSEKEANTILRKLKSGAEFTEMVQEHTISNEERLLDGRLGYESVERYGYMSPTLSKLQPGEHSDVIQYQTGEFHIYLCHDRMEGEPLTLKEARELVENEITKKKFQERRSEIIEQVKKQHKAVVNRQKLKELTIQI